jgi:ParB-like chromosome segregation protein Spo0J
MFWRRKEQPPVDVVAQDDDDVHYQPHVLACAYPMLTGADFDALVASIKSIGQVEPVVLYAGQILDGRNRYAACRAAGIKPHYKTFEGTLKQACEYVHATNSTRRHLLPSQRALAAALLCEAGGVALDDAVDRLKASRAQVVRARALLKHAGSDVIDLVSKGELTIAEAQRRAKLASKSRTPEGAIDKAVGTIERLVADGNALPADVRRRLASLAGIGSGVIAGASAASVA